MERNNFDHNSVVRYGEVVEPDAGPQRFIAQIKILGVEYDLVETSQPTFFGFPVLAMCDNHKCEITIAASTRTSQRLYLLLHEALHALSFMGHMQWLRSEIPGVDDEAKVDATASLIASVLKANKRTFAALIEDDSWGSHDAEKAARLL